MPGASSLDIKVVYSGSSRKRVRVRPSRDRGSLRRSTLMAFGLMNLLVSGGLYFGTWQWADPELRVKLLMHTPLPGVDLEAAADAFLPRQPVDRRVAPRRRGNNPSSLQQRTEAQTAQALGFAGTIVGWEVLATLVSCAMALSGGALVAKATSKKIRAGVLIAGLLGVVALGWHAYGLWQQYGRFVPDQIRIDIAALVAILGLVGLAMSSGARRLTRLAAILLILSAAGSVIGLHVGTHYEAITPDALPASLLTCSVGVFLIQSAWGWLLLPVASRI